MAYDASRFLSGLFPGAFPDVLAASIAIAPPIETPPAIIPEAEPQTPAEPSAVSVTYCRCGSTEYRDVPIHDGASTRRDCARCRRFIDFVLWYGKPSAN